MSIGESAINALLLQMWTQQGTIVQDMRVRRMLVSRKRVPVAGNATGTMLPPPFNETSLGIRTMLGEVSKAVHVSTARLTANVPDIAVIPLSTRDDINATTDKQAGMQERLDAQMWQENGGSDCQWEASWAKSIGGAAFWLTLPRDADFGLPDRALYDESDQQIEMLRREGKIAPTPRTLPGGALIYSEHGDVWASRRKEAMKMRAISGRSLFTLRAYPRDMVLFQRDNEARDLKWAAVIEEIPSTDCMPGAPFALNLAKAKGVKADDQGLWGVFFDKDQKRIIGGIPRGGPSNTQEWANGAFTLIRFFDREEQVILVAPRGTTQGATEIWRGPHGCKDQGVPACPVVEDPFYRTDVNIMGSEYATVLDPVFGYIPQMNQLMTLLSNVAAFNGIPRWVAELRAGDSQLRGEEGEPVNSGSGPVPGLNPNEIAAYPGTVKQLLIDDKTLIEVLRVYFERLDLVMPSLGGEASGADAAAWAIQMRIQEGQQPYERPVTNTCAAIAGIIRRWHHWLRQLDVPVYFFAAPGRRSNVRDLRGLIEFEPKNLTDSIRVTQDLDTPSEATVRMQIGMAQWQAGLIDDEEYYDKYAREQDARDAVIRRWVQLVVNYVMTGALPPVPPGSQPGPAPLVKIIADGVRGAVHYELIATSDNYAWAVADQMAASAQQQAAMQQQAIQPGAGQPGEAQGGASVPTPDMPGMGMAPTYDQQMGNPASMAPVMGGGM